MDFKRLKLPFRNNKDSYYQCPTCKNGHLKIKADTFKFFESSTSLKAHEYPDFDPDWISYVYSCIFECTNNACKETISSSGNGYVDWDIEINEDGYQEQIYSDYFRPLFFHPALKIIDIPKDVPDKVKDIINNSFDVVFVSPSSCVNHIRTAIEAILNDLKVTRFKLNKNNKRQLLNLHTRISNLPSKYNDLKEIFFALKWLGNDGSHVDADKINLSDALDAYEFLSYALEEVYEKKSETLKKKAKKINQSKGKK